jgi:hypothetical protein
LSCVVAVPQVSVLAEGSSLPLTELSELISRTLSSMSNNSSSPPAKQAAAAGAGAEPHSTQDAAAAATAAGGAQEAAAAAAGSTAEAGGGAGGGGPSALVVRNLIQEAASRKSYGLQDGECALAGIAGSVWDSPKFDWGRCL